VLSPPEEPSRSVTNPEKGGLGSAVRRVHGYCLESSDAMESWLAVNPNVPVEEVRAVVGATRGSAFPSIRGRKEGPWPVKPEFPFWDGRFHENAERGPSIVDACGHERSA